MAMCYSTRVACSAGEEKNLERFLLGPGSLIKVVRSACIGSMFRFCLLMTNKGAFFVNI
ncbi:hypothetical protein NRI_0835 [Neorickettsia risticii str. Illinois]|uniref:Uncharacterized protein n=1 Tax=Neorickettsia risticii (strain Illinois) TaxID=434131 RepID=C6V5Y5_NEORI|nr:hypothetical protein NRI_0835 [Neorickettsia risticii str. Illinois]